MPIYPVGFSIPESKITNSIPLKTKLLAHIVPGVRSTYIYNKEEDYYNELRSSFFAITKKKAGWDCLRHYEILANGCIPLFKDLELLPQTIMTHFPRILIRESNELYLKMREDGPLSRHTDRCYRYIAELLRWTRKNLTNQAMATYILSKSGHADAKSVLFLSRRQRCDYLRCLTLCGFKQLFRERCHDFPKIRHLYKNYRQFKRLYGKGMTYSRVLDDAWHTPSARWTIKRDILEHRYDIVVYGSLHRGLPYLDLVKRHYQEDEIIFLCGEDDHQCNYESYGVSPGNHLFIRELTFAPNQSNAAADEIPSMKVA